MRPYEPEPARRDRSHDALTLPLFWAGEATATDGGAECVHGALATGRRAALEALRLPRPASVTDPTSRLEWARYRN